MAIQRFFSRGLRLPSRVALILGLGALSTAAAQADAPEQSNLTSSGEVLVRSEAGRIYLSEGGCDTELQLSASPQRDHLLRLLEGHEPEGIKLNRDRSLLMSSGGGSGFFWWRTKQPEADKPAMPQDPQEVTPTPSSRERELAPPNQTPPADKKG